MLNFPYSFAVLVPCLLTSEPADSVSKTKPESSKTVLETPSVKTLQEMHDLRARLTVTAMKQQFYQHKMKKEPENRRKHQLSLDQAQRQETAIRKRIQTILESKLGAFVQVSADASLDCSEENYSEVILYATAKKRIRKNELLLFHAGDLYRTQAKFEPLRTTGQGFFFRPNREILAGARFRALCIQDAPEELENVRRGFMPHSDLARNPDRAYETRVTFQRRK